MMTLLGKVCHGVIANDYLVARIKKEKGLDQNCSSNQDRFIVVSSNNEEVNDNQHPIDVSRLLVREVS